MSEVKSPFIKNSNTEYFEKIPLLVNDYNHIKSQIEEASNKGRKEWYTAPQNVTLQGPYRHHLLKRRNYLETVLKKYSEKKAIGTLLDLGCGDGTNSVWLRHHTKNLFASDYNILRLLRAKGQDVIDEIVLADITYYPAADETFDVIFFNHVLEHIPNDTKALSEVYRILKKGGMCILGVPNEGALWWQLAYKFQPESLKNSDHVHFYTVKSLRPKLLASKFKIREVKSLGWGLPHWDYDCRVRGYKFLDDWFERIGKIVIPNQASSLYFILEKE